MKSIILLAIVLLFTSCAGAGYKPNYIMTQKEVQNKNLTGASDTSALNEQ